MPSETTLNNSYFNFQSNVEVVFETSERKQKIFISILTSIYGKFITEESEIFASDAHVGTNMRRGPCFAESRADIAIDDKTASKILAVLAEEEEGKG